MVSVKQLLTSGKLAEALDEAKQAVKQHPTDVERRIGLFELSCFNGAWDSAQKQLDVIANQEPVMAQGIEVYANVLHAEQERACAIEGELIPKSLSGEMPPRFAQLSQMFGYVHREEYGKAQEVNQVLQQAHSAGGGTINEKPFEELLDGDDRFSLIVEALFHQWYVWIPFSDIRRITMQSPKHLRDLLWIPAEVELWQNDIFPVFLPVLYPNSWKASDGHLRLGQHTRWISPGGDLVLGEGQRMWMVDGEDRSLLSCAQVNFHSSPMTS